MTSPLFHLIVAWILTAWILTSFLIMRNLALWERSKHSIKEISGHQSVTRANLWAFNTFWQIVNFGHGTSKEMWQQQMSGPHGFQLEWSQCDILYDTLCSLLEDVLGREKKVCKFLLCQILMKWGLELGWKNQFCIELWLDMLVAQS
jgi:hypothetical protein